MVKAYNYFVVHLYMIFKYLTIFFLLSFAQSAFGLCVTSYKAHLYKSPRPDGRISWTVGRYTPLIKLKTTSWWYKVADQDGDEHWVRRSKVSDSMDCVSVKFKKANIRTGPGTWFPLANYRYAEKYEAFKRLKVKGDWYYLENSIGEKGWVNVRTIWKPVKSIYLVY